MGECSGDAEGASVEFQDTASEVFQPELVAAATVADDSAAGAEGTASTAAAAAAIAAAASALGVGDIRRICPSCGRKFNPSSFERHQRICQRVFRTIRPQFDYTKGSVFFSKNAAVSTQAFPVVRSGDTRASEGSPVKITSASGAVGNRDSGEQQARENAPEPAMALGTAEKGPTPTVTSAVVAEPTGPARGGWRHGTGEPQTPILCGPRNGRTPGAQTSGESKGGSTKQLGGQSQGSSFRDAPQTTQSQGPLRGIGIALCPPTLEEQEERVRRVMELQMREVHEMRRCSTQGVLTGPQPPQPAPPPPPPTSPILASWSPVDERPVSQESQGGDASSRTPQSRESQQPSHCPGVLHPHPRSGPVAVAVEAKDDCSNEFGGLREVPPTSSQVSRATKASGANKIERSYTAPSLPSTPAASVSTGNSDEHPQNSSNLKVCEDCGRRFNPASFEKHRTICRTVFGKSSRTPFESHTQRLRALPVSLSPPRARTESPTLSDSGAGPRSALVGIGQGAVVRRTSGPKPRISGGGPGPPPVSLTVLSLNAATVPCTSPAQEPQPQSPAASTDNDASTFEGSVIGSCGPGANGARGSTPSGTSTNRKASPQRQRLETCPHCGRSFRYAAIETHVKVCQSVFPTHDTRSRQRQVYDSRRHRLKGTPFEAFTSRSLSPPPSSDQVVAPTSPSSRSNKQLQQPRSPTSQVSSQVSFFTSPDDAGRSRIASSSDERAAAPRTRSPAQGQSNHQQELAAAGGATAMDETQPLATPTVEEMCRLSNDGVRRGRDAEGLSAKPSDLYPREDGSTSRSPRVRGDQSSWESRRGLLERARLDMKMGQLQDQQQQQRSLGRVLRMASATKCGGNSPHELVSANNGIGISDCGDGIERAVDEDKLSRSQPTIPLARELLHAASSAEAREASLSPEPCLHSRGSKPATSSSGPFPSDTGAEEPVAATSQCPHPGHEQLPSSHSAESTGGQLRLRGACSISTGRLGGHLTKNSGSHASSRWRHGSAPSTAPADGMDSTCQQAQHSTPPGRGPQLQSRCPTELPAYCFQPQGALATAVARPTEPQSNAVVTQLAGQACAYSASTATLEPTVSTGRHRAVVHKVLPPEAGAPGGAAMPGLPAMATEPCGGRGGASTAIGVGGSNGGTAASPLHHVNRAIASAPTLGARRPAPPGMSPMQTAPGATPAVAAHASTSVAPVLSDLRLPRPAVPALPLEKIARSPTPGVSYYISPQVPRIDMRKVQQPQTHDWRSRAVHPRGPHLSPNAARI